MITGYFSMIIMLVVAFSSLTLWSRGIFVFFISYPVCIPSEMLTSFLILMPCVMLSWFMFPIKNMPDIVQYATYMDPMRRYLEILRGIVMKNVGLKVLWSAMAGQRTLAVAFLGEVQQDRCQGPSIITLLMGP
jgi:ABC-2 type transport system permease protein